MIAAGLGSFAAFLLTFARASGWTFSAPLTGDATFAARFRLATAFVIALALAPLRGAVPFSALPAMLPAEILAGLAVGLIARILLAGAEAGGQLLGLAMELGFAGQFDPSLREQVIATRKMAWSVAGLAFLGAGGLESSVRALAVPVGERFTVGHVVPALVDATNEVIPLGLRAAAPLIIAALVANVAVAIASRAAPAINVFTVMLPMLLVVGGAVLIWDAPALTAELHRDARHAIDGALRLAVVMR